MYNVSETVLPIYINGQCPIIKTCSDVTLNLSSKDSTQKSVCTTRNKPFAEGEGNSPLQLSLRTQFAKTDDKKFIVKG